MLLYINLNHRERKVEHCVFVKRWTLPLFDMGKTLEIRIAITRFKFVKKGDTIVFSGTIKRTVKAIRWYPSFMEMGRWEKPEHILPGASTGQIIEALKRVYSKELEKKGVLVFELLP